MVNAAASGYTTEGYTVEDLRWLRNEIGLAARLELDPWGSLIVAPTDDKHGDAVSALCGQAFEQLDLPEGCIRPEFSWIVPGGTGYLMIPDLTIVAPGWRRVDELHVEPPPLLVVEIASPSTRRADRGRKLADYRLGGAGLYLLVDLPSTFELHDLSTGAVTTATGSIDLVVGRQAVQFRL